MHRLRYGTISTILTAAIVAAVTAKSIDTSAVSNADCRKMVLDFDDVNLLPDNNIYVKELNVTIPVQTYFKDVKNGPSSGKELHLKNSGHNLQVCIEFTQSVKEALWINCDKWTYENDELVHLENGSVLLFREMLHPGTYELKDGKLYTCIHLDHQNIAASGRSVADASYETRHTRDLSAKRSQTECDVMNLDVNNVTFIDNGNVIIIELNLTLLAEDNKIMKADVHICFVRSAKLKEMIYDKCQKWDLNSDEYTVLANGSVIMTHNNEMLEEGTYQFESGVLTMCVTQQNSEDYAYAGDNVIGSRGQDIVGIKISRITSYISIAALSLHIVIFILLKSLRDLPGYTTFFFSVSLLLGYTFFFIGQIPQVLDVWCHISGVLLHYFFLVSFFCLNAMAVDVWMTLHAATHNLNVDSNLGNIFNKRFFCLIAYSWGMPAVITFISVVLDLVGGMPEWLTTAVGAGDICYITTQPAKITFVVAPVFILFCLNGVLFVWSAFMIFSNKMKTTSENRRHASTKICFFLYLGLAILMGCVWLIYVVSYIVDEDTVWRICNFVMGSQGLLVVIALSLPKVITLLKDKPTMRKIIDDLVKGRENLGELTSSDALMADTSKSTLHSTAKVRE